MCGCVFCFFISYIKMSLGCRRVILALLMLLLAVGEGMADSVALKVAVLDDAPPLGYRDENGRLTGFSTSVMQAVCAESGAKCEFFVVQLENMVDELAAGRLDVAAVGLLNTAERRQKILFTRPVYRSLTLLFVRPGVLLGRPGVRLSTFRGSAQERYIKAQGWDYVGAQNAGEMIEQLKAGVTQGCVVPLMTSLHLQRTNTFLQLDLQMSVMRTEELESSASFGISPQRADLKPLLDKALDKIKLNGVYDRINSQFLPFRVD
jgi:ABC-type amino acid transport substrate-binding protein